MGGFFVGPPSGSSYPDIPVVDIVQLGQQISEGAKKGDLIDQIIVKGWHYFREFMGVVLSGAIGIFDEMAAFFLQVITHAQGIGQKGMLDLMAAVLGDLLGVEYNTDELTGTITAGGRLKAMTTTGGWLYDTLATEFHTASGSGTLTPTSAPAKSFLGFMIEFAVREGNLSMMAELIPEQFSPFEGLREYGELLARNLGLGRLTRRALQPLIQTLISEPLQWQLNRQYRPKLLAEAQYVKAMHRGQLRRDQIDEWLSWLGYSDDAIEIVIAETQRPWQARELIELMRLKQMDDQTAISLLQLQGIDQGTAQQWWTSDKAAETHSLVREFGNLVLRQFRDGFITWETAREQITALPLLPDEIQWYYNLIGDKGAFFWRHLSEGEIERAFLGGIIDMTAAQTYWTRLGYAPDSVQTLTFLLLEKQAAGQRARGGHVPHKHLSEAQLEKAYEGGILDLAQIQAGWQNLGYSPADQQVLTALVTAKTPPPGTTTLPGVTVP